MAKGRRRKVVSLPELSEAAPILVVTDQDVDGMKRIVELQKAFGDDVRARIVPGRVDGKKALLVVIRYTSYRAVAGQLDDGLTRQIGRQVRWLARWNRVVGCTALIDGDVDSPNYLNVWLNPVRESDVREQRQTQNT